jgi:hypothetical protein
MPLETNARGHLYLGIPRIKYVISAALLSLAALLFAAWIANDPVGGGGLPGWFRMFSLIFCAASAIGFGWWSAYGSPLEFDERLKCLVRGKRTIARFADVDHVEILEKRAVNYVFYRVILRLKRSRNMDLGPQRSQIDASTMAADIARVIDRPVRVVVR